MDVRPGSATTLVMRALIHAERRGYLVGLVMGRGCRGLLPRRTDLLDTFRMLRYYLGIPFAKLTRRKWLHPRFNTKYNALQRAAYFSVPIAGFLSVATAGRFTSRCSSIGWLRSLVASRSARLAFLAHVALHPFRCAPCDSGFRRRVGYVPQHDRRLVGESNATGGHGK